MQYKNAMALGSKFTVSFALFISLLFSGCETATNTNASRQQTSMPNYSANSNMMSNSSMESDAFNAPMDLRKQIGSDVETQGERYAQIVENPFLETSHTPLSTFSIDIDTASYANVRRYLNDGQFPPGKRLKMTKPASFDMQKQNQLKQNLTMSF